METTEQTAEQAAAQTLSLPSLDGLSEQQVRGITCVWDGIMLTPETAINLGPRRKRHLDGHFDWYPRGCRNCTAERALRALQDHAPLCEQCVDTAEHCDTGIGLRRLIRLGRR